jgi:hypothetical protein
MISNVGLFCPFWYFSNTCPFIAAGAAMKEFVQNAIVGGPLTE